jgi:hypothetical protein
MAVDLDGPNSAINVNTIETHSGSTLTIGKSGDTVSLGSGASASGFAKGGAVTWDSSIKSANTSITSGTGFFVDTSSAAITITLPSSPSVGDIVAMKDYARTFDTNNLTIARNGSNIQGAATDSLIDTEGASVMLVYADSTKGWLYTVESNVPVLGPEFVTATGGTITTSGDFKIHTFNSSGTFTVSSAGNPVGSNSIEYLVIAGGGGGSAGGGNGGGGGAGGLRTNFPSPATGGFPVSATGYTVTIGSGAATGSPYPARGNQGSNSVFATITSAGGGGGASDDNAPPLRNGADGGSGGGGGGGGGGPGPNNGGSGNVPSVSPPQGNPGGTTNPPGNMGGGGGGGSNGAGGTVSGPNNNVGDGGGGRALSITGSPVDYAGGGGGGADGGGTGGAAGPGGGGRGGDNNGTTNMTAGSANTGGGGGGSGGSTGGAAGGSGKVIIRYKFQ